MSIVKTNAYSRSIQINVPLDLVASFVANVANLPRWTFFFQRLEKQIEPNRAHFITPLGACETEIVGWTEGTVIHLKIISRFPGKAEQAEIQLGVAAGKTEAIFFIHLPETMTEQQISSMLSSLGQELQQLKQILEAGYA